MGTEDEKKLATLYKNQPVRPMIPSLIFSETTVERLWQRLGTEWPSCMLATAEGGVIFGSRAMSREHQLAMISTWNELYSGMPISVGRKGDGDTKIYDARLTISIFIQPEIFRKLLTPLFQETCRLTKISFKLGEQEETSGKVFTRVQRSHRIEDCKSA